MTTPAEPHPAAEPSLWTLTATPGLSGRVLVDEAARVRLESMANGTTLGPNRHILDGAVVLLRTSTQMAAALALLELDGLARRIVLCTPDLSLENMLLAVAATEATVVVCDEAAPDRADLERAGLACIVSTSPSVTLSDRPPGGDRETEWALFTSGTTGPPKLVLHRLRALTGAVVRPANHDGPRGIWSTFYDIRRYGGLQILLRALVGGGSMVLSHTAEGCGNFLARVLAAGVTFISGTPTHWRGAMLNASAASLTAADVRLSGEVADQAILDKLRAAYPSARVRHAFASTEAGVAFEVADGLAGFPAEWVDTVRGGVALAVKDGTLRIRSDRAASRYLGGNAEALMDEAGFVDTKDLVELRGDRYFFLGRSDGVINVGGLKVHPEEVEAIVNRHPRVSMSLAKAKRSPIIGAVVMVEIVLRDHDDEDNRRSLEAEILDSCRQTMEWWKVPAIVKIVSSLPVSAAGKLIRTGG